jgi:serine/threonine protein kinase
MIQLARAVHFVHNGGYKVSGTGWNVFHRDIKNANICLVDNFTPRLIDNGLVKFLIDDNSNGSFAFLCRTQLAALHWEPQDVCAQ